MCWPEIFHTRHPRMTLPLSGHLISYTQVTLPSYALFGNTTPISPVPHLPTGRPVASSPNQYLPDNTLLLSPPPLPWSTSVPALRRPLHPFSYYLAVSGHSYHLSYSHPIAISLECRLTGHTATVQQWLVDRAEPVAATYRGLGCGLHKEGSVTDDIHGTKLIPPFQRRGLLVLERDNAVRPVCFLNKHTYKSTLMRVECSFSSVLLFFVRRMYDAAYRLNLFRIIFQRCQKYEGATPQPRLR